MFTRLSVSTILALLGAFALTAIGHAQEFQLNQPDREEVIFGTALLALGLMVLVFIAYLVRISLGLEQTLLPMDQDPHAHGHFHDDAPDAHDDAAAHEAPAPPSGAHGSH